MIGRRAGRDPAVRALLLAAGVTSALGALHHADPGPPSVGALVTSGRFADVALLLAAAVGAVVGARVRSGGLAVAWWTAGADRLAVVGRTVLVAVRSSLLVPLAFWAADAVTTTVRRGLPEGLDGLGRAGRTVVVGLLAAVVVSGLGALVGLLVGRVWWAVAAVAAGSLPFAAEGLDLVATGHGWAYALSPFGAARGVVLTGTGNELLGYDVDRRIAVWSALAVLAWAVAMVAPVLRRPLVPPPSRLGVPPWVPTGLAALAVAALGALGPRALAPDVAWQLRPGWRHAEAEGTSSRQQALGWLACRQDAEATCERYEVAGGVELPDATRRVLAQGRGATAAPPRFQTAPEVVTALVEVRPRRSGTTVVRGASIALHLTQVADDRWVVDEVSPVRAVR